MLGKYLLAPQARLVPRSAGSQVWPSCLYLTLLCYRRQACLLFSKKRLQAGSPLNGAVQTDRLRRLAALSQADR